MPAMIWWFFLADLAGGALLAGLLYHVGRKSASPIPMGSAIGVGAFVVVLAGLFYIAAWLIWQAATGLSS
jgi:hypothetical protein